LFLAPVPLIVILYARWKDSASVFRKQGTVALVACGLVIAVLLPNVMVLIAANSIVNRASLMGNERERASFISQRVIEMTAFGGIPRADTNYWKFLLSGAGMCGEMAIAGTNFMTAAGLVAREIVLPGEDHSFIEVKIGDEWLVADPGYYGPELITRSERAAGRFENVGSVSYVVTCTEKTFIELTQQYVPTDTIVIRIRRNGEYLADAEVLLKHRFGQLTTQLPCGDRVFHADTSGAVTLHLGKIYYTNEFKGSEEYYWIYVNGQNTGYNVTSTGTGQIHSIEIDLS